jgi:hypothetical protein
MQVSDDSHQFPSVVSHVYGLLPSVPASVALDCALKHVTLPVMTCDYPNVISLQTELKLQFWYLHLKNTSTQSRELHISFVMSVLPSACLSACINAAHIGCISVKCNIGDFYVHLSINPNFFETHMHWLGNFKINLPEIYSARTAQ